MTQQVIQANANVTTGYITVFINDVDRTEYVLRPSISITDYLNQKINTCSFKTYDIDNTFVPENGQEVVIYDAYGNKVFGGSIVNISERRIALNPNTGTELLEQQVSCQDFTRLLQKKLIVETFQNMTCLEIIESIIASYYPLEGFTVNNVETGPTVTQISFNYKTGDAALEALAQAVGFQWYVDYDKDIHFFDADALTSEMTISDTTENWKDLIITPDTSQIRNRIYIRGGIYYSDPYTQAIEADGVQEEYLLAYTPNTVGFALDVNGVSRSVGLHNIDEADDYDFLLNRKEKSLKMGNTAWAQVNTPLAADAVITCVYEYEIPVLIVQEDSDSIESLKALEGGDGIYEHIIIDKNITSVDTARDRAAAELRDYANAITRGSVNSYDSGASFLRSGDIFTINSTRRGISANYLIQSITATQITYNQFRYSISFSGRLYGFVDVLLSLFKRSQEIVLGLDEVLDAFLRLRDNTTGIIDGGLNHYLKTPPFKWSDDAGTTANKARWNLAEWYAGAYLIPNTEWLIVRENIGIVRV